MTAALINDWGVMRLEGEALQDALSDARQRVAEVQLAWLNGLYSGQPGCATVVVEAEEFLTQRDASENQ